MAQIRMSKDEITCLSRQCNLLADKYEENIEETLKILQSVDSAWGGVELSAYVQQLNKSISETEKAKQMLLELSLQLASAAESMRSYEQQITSQIRGIFE